jgi:hypothetical protein
MGRTFLMRRSLFMGGRIVATPPQRVNVRGRSMLSNRLSNHRVTAV